MTSRTDRLARAADRLAPLASTVLGSYPLDVRSLTHLATHSNTMYRVVTTDGREFVLRVGSPSSNSSRNMVYEAAWLVALERDTDLDVVRVFPSADGYYVVEATDLDGSTRACMLFSWIPGEPLGHGAGSFGYRSLGALAARLHQHGRQWEPPQPAGMRRWNQVFYYEEELAPVVIDDPRFDHLFSDSRDLLYRARGIAQAVIDEQWVGGGAQVVHGDLHEWNVHTAGARLYVFDFEDVMMALPAQDVAISLYSTRSHGRSLDVVDAFRRGYEEIAPWPIPDQRVLDGLMAARQLMLMNHAARTLPEKETAQYFGDVIPWLATFVDSYR